MNIECLDFRPIQHEVLKGTAKIKIKDWGIIINDVKLFKKLERSWVHMPSREYEKDGEKMYYPTIQFEDPNVEKILKQEILDSIVNRIRDVKEDHANYTKTHGNYAYP